MLSQSILHSEITCFYFRYQYTSGIHYIIIRSFLYSNFHLLDRIHVFGKLLGVGENVTDLESEEHLMYNITLSLHGSTVVSAMHTYIIHLVHGGSLLHYIMYTVEDAVEQLPFTTHLSVTYSCTPDICT